MRNSVFTWGEFDKNDIKHFFIGGGLYCIIYIILLFISKINFHLSLDVEWIALIGNVFCAFIWEFGQKWRYGVKMDFKDILVSNLTGIIITVIINI